MAVGCTNYSRIPIGHGLRNVGYLIRQSKKYDKIDFLNFFSCQSVQNLGLAVISMISGMIVDHGGYFMLEIFFIGWLSSKSRNRSLKITNFNSLIFISVALIATVIIWLYDTNTNGNLNMTPYEREQHISTM